LWPGDAQSISTLQEWIGYLLTPDPRQQKILLLVGPRRSGKGTIARVIRGLIGADNIAGPTLSSLGTNFGLWPLLGKAVAMIQDARLSGRTDAATVAERLLSISGEDDLTIDRKNLSPVTTRLTARFMRPQPTGRSANYWSGSPWFPNHPIAFIAQGEGRNEQREQKVQWVGSRTTGNHLAAAVVEFSNSAASPIDAAAGCGRGEAARTAAERFHVGLAAGNIRTLGRAGLHHAL
jgi:energy-coupling factor transporter ATP-binding protein EcfA2